jgi:uncharacterized membrane protein (UPF0136 family)
MNTSTNEAPTSAGIRIQQLLTAIGAAGIPAIILPFTFEMSPLAAVRESDFSLWRLAWPFFLPVLILPAVVRWLFLKKHSQIEIIAGYIVGTAILGITFSAYLLVYEWPWNTRSQIAFLSPIIILAFGIFIVLRNRKKLIPGPAGAIVVMQVAYIANCLLCLITSIDGWQMAAYLSLATSVAYLAQIILLVGDGMPDKRVNKS